jgi:phenylpropionate dioxygenase-like ring-hydroxylating dioxygenase large terminal subunit
MLSKQDNELLCRVGPGTAMGDVMRRYWLPALTSEELPAPDCPPLRLRLLGENLIAFRTTSGRAGIIQNACPHRGASLFFGRNEEEGLRCVYHGWKYDVTGQCVDMPSEPPVSNFKTKVRARAYPCVERNGVVWTYMGTADPLPPLPEFEANMVSPEKYTVRIQKIMRECNYMQALEGDIDTAHSEFLHFGAIPQSDTVAGTGFYHRRSSKPLRFVVADMPFGTTYAAYRPVENDSTYWRIANFLFPCFTMTPTGILGDQVLLRAWVPLDDDTCMFWSIIAEPAGRNVRLLSTGSDTPNHTTRSMATHGNEYEPFTSDWLGRWRLNSNRDNDFLLDRDEQRNLSYSGLPGVWVEDGAMTESMGVIYERSQEHLGTTDAMIIQTRKRLIDAAKALRDRGEEPPGAGDGSVFATRSGWVVLPNGVDWLEGSKELRRAFVERKLEDLVTPENIVPVS